MISPKVSLRPFCPMPGHQRDANSCTAFAVGYGAMTCARALRRGLDGRAAIAQSTFSSAFIYNQVKTAPADCREGISVESALRFLKMQGNCRSAEFDTVRGCAVQPAAPLLDSAKQHRIRDFAAVLPYGRSSGQVISTLCSYLRDSVPVVAVVQAYERFVFPRPGETLWKKRPGERELGVHCVVVTGYDETDRTFEVLSSWGTEWADGGFCRVAWEDMGTACLAAYVLFPSGPTKANLGLGLKPGSRPASPTAVPTLGAFTLEGTFDLVRVTEVDTGYVFGSETMRRDTATGFYAPKSGVFPLNTRYQLRTSGTASGQYLYIFSCDAAGKVEQHYPKPFFSALSPGRHALITVPSPQSALRLSLPGDDVVCILYSEQEIPHLSARLSGMKDCRRDNFSEKLHAALGDLLVQPTEGNRIEYAADRMSVRANVTEGKGVAVPVVLCLRAE
ncbi:MAG: hypothetical protein IPK82_23700 [Polyangiaceae bacterium]|nr:hypothetical protein [Polyangiaceae bacterium]